MRIKAVGGEYIMIYYGSGVWVWLWRELGLYRYVVAGGRVAC